MKNLTFTLAALFLLLTGCVRDNDSSHGPQPSPWTEYDFSTVMPMPLSVSYSEMDGISASVYFEVYDRQPVVANADGTGYIFADANLEPLFAGYTDADGRFSGVVELPSYLEKAYIYTPAFFARTLMTATRTNGVLTASDALPAESAAPSTRAKSYESQAVTKDGWKTWLGKYDTQYGRIKYAYTGSLRETNYAALYTAHASVINSKTSCPQEYRSSNDLYLSEDAEVVITLLGSNTCWNCSMGYYYYSPDKKPQSLDKANVIMIFPNTQDGTWSNDPNKARKYKGVDRGTAVQLMYYPHIADNSQEGATTAFPKGYRIGFVLATNAWSNRLPGFEGSKLYRAATSDGLSLNNQGTPYNKPRTAVYRYTDAQKGINSVLFSFEDFTNDENFSDVVFTMTSNPIEAVTDIPSIDVDDAKKTAKILRGVYAFEDLWPSRGDYDMNDVMVRSNYEKVFNENGIYEESFLLKTYANFAGNANGLAVSLSGAAATADLEFYVLRPGTEAWESADFTRDGSVILLTSNVKEDMGSTYKVTAKYSAPIAETKSGTANPFIYRTERDGVTPGKRWEVHIPYEAPSEKAEMSFFGMGDDRSDPARGIYYVRNKQYPFAFFLSGATDANVAKLLDPANEKTPVDQLYPRYSSWVQSLGKTDGDWYKN